MYSKKIKKNKGFTLIEMLAVLAIFGILLAVVIFNYNKFTNDTILTNMAYEIALSVREVQVFGTAVVNPQGATIPFKTPMGLHFDVSGDPTNSYLFFIDDINSGTPLKYDVVEDQISQTFTLQKNIKITELKVCEYNATTGTLDIVFKRPNPEPWTNELELQHSQIKLISPQGSIKYVIINPVGEVTVSNTPAC